MKRHIVIIIFIAVFASGCEKVIPVKLDDGTPQLTVDAFIDNTPGIQKIRLTKTGAYFNNAPNSSATGATVKITDDEGRVYDFLEVTNSGDYIWTPLATDTLVRIFNTYKLSVTYAGEEFSATSVAYPAPVIDSVNYVLRDIIGGANAGKQEYMAAFYASDIADMPNFYWIKSYQNDVFYSKPVNINLSQDGAFGGGGTDGLLFIQPIREAITPSGNTIVLGDSLTVKLCAINPDTYFYLNEVLGQTTNAGLFATPPSNVSTNIKNVNPGSTTKVVGFFNIGEVTFNGVRIK